MRRCASSRGPPRSELAAHVIANAPGADWLAGAHHTIRAACQARCLLLHFATRHDFPIAAEDEADELEELVDAPAIMGAPGELDHNHVRKLDVHVRTGRQLVISYSDRAPEVRWVDPVNVSSGADSQPPNLKKYGWAESAL